MYRNKHAIALYLVVLSACAVTLPPTVFRGTFNGEPFKAVVESVGPYDAGTDASADAGTDASADASADAGLSTSSTVASLGFNLDMPWSPGEFSFENKVKSSPTDWISGSWSTWDDGRPLPLDPNGELTAGSLQSDQHALMLVPHHGLGEQMSVTWTGPPNAVLVAGADSIKPNSIIVTPPSGDPNILLRAVETPVSDLVVRRSGSMSGGLWDVQFIDSLRGVSVVRPMQWQQTNDYHGPIAWQDRTLPGEIVQMPRVAYEYQIDLANVLGSDVWLNIPDTADESYALELGRIVGRDLGKSQKIYLEWSNEVWNGAFPQHDRAMKEAQNRALVGDPNVALWRYIAVRTVEMAAAFDVGCRCRSRTVRAVNAQNGFEFQHDEMLGAVPRGTIDALAVAPYFGRGIGSDPTRILSDGTSWIFDTLEADVEAEIADIQRSASSARKHGVSLVAYEGGQHVVLEPTYHQHSRFDELHQTLASIQTDDRMAALYGRLLAGWTHFGGTVFTHYTLSGSYSRWGYWGSMSRNDRIDSLKYQALKSWAR